ncbi:MAG: FliA/WhiG family RNA polymerase sigma factor [Verrucomicrobiota bacterium]
MIAAAKKKTKKKATGNKEDAAPFPTHEVRDRDEAIEELLPLAHHIVSRMSMFLPSYLSRDDLTSAAVIGLINAVDNYDPTKGTSLKTYCSLRIKGSVLDELRRLNWAPRSVVRESRKLQKVQEELAQKLGREPTEEEVRQEIGLTAREFEDLVDRVKPVSFFSLQDTVGDGIDGDSLCHEEVVADPKSQCASEIVLHEEDKDLLKQLLNTLPMQQMQVLTLYYLEDLRLKEIAEILGLTESRVSQVHTLAVNRLRSAFMRVRKR